MNTELPALMATCVVWDATSLGQKSSEDLASAVSVILHVIPECKAQYFPDAFLSRLRRWHASFPQRRSQH